MNLFQIDYKRLVLQLLPPFLRQPRIFAFMTALTFGVEYAYHQFCDNREINLLRLRRNGQVCYLEKLLNDELDNYYRRISITDIENEYDRWLWAMDEEESYQWFVETEWLNEEGKLCSKPENMVCSETLLLSNTAWFYVTVPFSESEVDSVNKLNSFLSEYKLLSKKYVINYEQAKL